MPNGQPNPYAGQPRQSSWDQLNAASQQYLGNPLSQQDYFNYTNSGKDYQQKNVDYAINNMKYGPEAQAYAQSQQPQQQQAPAEQVQGPAPNAQSSGGPTTPGVPASYNAGPTAGQYVAQAAGSAQQLQSQYAPQQINEFMGYDINAPSYANQLFSQFSDPTNQQTQAQKQTLLQNLLANPQSLNQTWQDQMFEKQKDDANAFAQQMGLQNQQHFASSGRDMNSQFAQGQQQDVQNELMRQLLSGRRDIATQAALQNRQDELNALNMAEQVQSGDVNRAGNIYQNTLAGQQAKAQDAQFAAQFGLNKEQAISGNKRDNYNSYLAGKNLQGQENARGEQYRQSAFGLSQQSLQNAKQSALQEWLAQNNSDLGWANYGLNADDQFLNYLSGM
jgi:hypothetical protein